jgi:hypothetical protein
MSIRTQIAHLCKAEALHAFPFGPQRGPRHLFVSTDVLKTIVDGSTWDSSIEGKLYVRANTRLEAYAWHAEIPFALDPSDKEPRAAFARVSPVELGVISVRAWTQNRKHHIRVFGCFSEKDWFVALTPEFRTGLDFDKAAEQCRDAWDKLFGDYSPHQGGSVHDYLSSDVTPV